MPITTSSIQNTHPFYSSSRSLEEGDSRSKNLKAAVIGPDVVIRLDHTRPLHTRSIEQAPTSYKPGLKAAVLSTIALLGTVGIYCVRKVFGGNDPIHANVFSQIERTGLDISRGFVSERAIPTVLPLEDQVALPGSLFQVSHQFFTEVGGGFIQQKIIQGPSWLTSQLNPIVSNYHTPGTAWSVQVVGTTAYVADGPNGLKIINIATPSSPTLIGTYNPPGQQAQGVQVIGTTAYVAGMANGLEIINVAMPSSPTLIGTYNTPGQQINEVQVVGTTAYVTDYNGGLQIINIATPSRPTLIGTYRGHTAGVQIVGNIAYVTDVYKGLQIINITTSSNPTLIGAYNTAGFANGVQVVGTAAYVKYLGGGLKIINIATPSKPTLIGTYDPLGGAGVQVVGTTATAYLVDYSGGRLAIINIATPSSPILIGTYDTLGGARVQVIGTTAYVAAGDSGLQILSGLNRLKLSGNSSVLDRSNYVVTLEGTTIAGTITTSFALSIGGNLAPVYQNPISMQKAMVDENFKYVMPDIVFVDPNGDAMIYKTQGLPKWLVFDASKRTFSGTPTPGDTGTYADQSTIVSVIASDGKLETPGQFMVTVTGESYLAKVIKIVGPTFTVLGTLYSGYKNRALLLDQIAKRKWKNNQMNVRLGEHFMYELKTNAKDIRKLQAYVRDKGFLGKMSEKILRGKERHIELASSLPTWMGYNTEVNTVYSVKPLDEIDLMGHRNIQIRVLGSGGVIKELLHVTLEGDAPTFDGTFDSLTRIEQERVGLLLFPPTNAIEMDGIGSGNNEMDQILDQQMRM